MKKLLFLSMLILLSGQLQAMTLADIERSAKYYDNESEKLLKEACVHCRKIRGDNAFITHAEDYNYLSHVAEVADVQTLTTLLKNGEKADEITPSGATAISIALKRAHHLIWDEYECPIAKYTECIKLLIDYRCPVDTHEQDHYLPGITPLIRAASAGLPSIVALLLNAGADPAYCVKGPLIIPQEGLSTRHFASMPPEECAVMGDHFVRNMPRCLRLIDNAVKKKDKK
jgi:hypothetical protein